MWPPNLPGDAWAKQSFGASKGGHKAHFFPLFAACCLQISLKASQVVQNHFHSVVAVFVPCHLHRMDNTDGPDPKPQHKRSTAVGPWDAAYLRPPREVPDCTGYTGSPGSRDRAQLLRIQGQQPDSPSSPLLGYFHPLLGDIDSDFLGGFKFQTYSSFSLFPGMMMMMMMPT